MKHRIFFALLAVLGMVPMYAQDAELNSVVVPDEYVLPEDTNFMPDTVLGIHPYKDQDVISPIWRHWSIGLDLGGNVFMGDFTSSEVVNTYGAPTANINLMYSFNSTWSLGVMYGFSMYRVRGKDSFLQSLTTPREDNLLLNGHIHKAAGFLNVDLFNAFRPQNKHKLFDFSVILGGGGAWYHRDFYFQRNDKSEWLKTAGYVKNSYKEDEKGKYSDGTGFVMAGLDFQFNVSRSISVGMKMMYSFFLGTEGDLLDGRYMVTYNDGIGDLAFSMRYKIDAHKHSHVLNGVRHDVHDVYPLPNRAPMRDTIVISRDTVIINNVINNVSEPSTDVVPVVAASSQTVVVSPDFYVYFANNKANLDDVALDVIQQVASTLAKGGDKVYLGLIGYCDNTASSKYNMGLAQKRADRVAEELKSEYGIAADHIGMFGQGIIKGRHNTASYAPNRRVEIRLMTKAEFDKFSEEQNRLIREKMEALNQPATKPVMQPTPAPKEEPAPQPAAQPTMELRTAYDTAQTIVVEPGETLAMMARKYYGNAFCWIFIFHANQSVIPNPDRVEDGITLAIPVLTDKEMAIDKHEAYTILKRIR